MATAEECSAKEVQLEKALGAEQLQVKNVAIIADLDIQQRISHDVAVVVAKLLVLVKISHGLEVLFKLLLSQEAHVNKVLEVESDGGLVADRVGDLVAIVTAVVVLAIALVVVAARGRVRLVVDRVRSLDLGNSRGRARDGVGRHLGSLVGLLRLLIVVLGLLVGIFGLLVVVLGSLVLLLGSLVSVLGLLVAVLGSFVATVRGL